MSTRTLVVIAAIALVAAACSPGSESADPTSPTGDDGATSTRAPSAAGTVAAPDFPAGLDWLNVPAPLDLASLRGKVVLLDFWTYGCINCIHIIPDLKRLEAEYPDELVVIGVHSAKFSNESNTENIREVIQRYDLEHPVVNDANFEIWNSWGARAWPTVALIDPAGNAVGTHAGEGVYEVVAPVLANLVSEFRARGEINPDPVELRLEKERSAPTVLSYPGKVIAVGDMLYIADTGHNRVIAATSEGEVEAVYGNGTAGFDDGPSLQATFSAPQGLAVVGETLYVADTNNHAVRAVDLDSGEVTTVAGDGIKGYPPEGGSFDEVRLASPWALAADADILYVANAGTHQIWRFDLTAETAEPFVGSGAEGVLNGPLAEAELAQPSGLAIHDGVLYFADSESSSIRGAELTAGGVTRLVAGGELTLFDFGDEDGVGAEARFQHPLGIAVHDGRLLVADTYNSKIKAIDPASGETTTLYGSEQGWADGAVPLFHEPGGIAVAGDILWVADTNNHVIRRIDLTSGAAATLVLSGLDVFVTRDDSYSGPLLTLPAVNAGAGAARINLDVSLPPGYKVNEEASSSLFLSQEGDVALFPDGERVDLTGVEFPVPVALTLVEGSGAVIADLTLVWCREDAEGLCYYEQLRYRVPIQVAADGPSAVIDLPLVLEEPEI